MHLKSLQIQNFRNIESLEDEFNSGFNVIVGGNAQGKTNLMEAIYVLTSVRSFRGSRTSELVRKEEGQRAPGAFKVLGQLKTREVKKELQLTIQGNSKKIELNGKEVRRAEGIMNQFKTVVFTPDDLFIVKGGPELRRRFIDVFAFNIKPSHWTNLKRYQSSLHHRNRLLKMGITDKGQMEPWEMQIVELGTEVIKGRCFGMKELRSTVEEVFGSLVGTGGPKIALRYNSSLFSAEPEEAEEQTEAIKEKFRIELIEQRTEEIRRGMTLVGPHRDDIKINIGERGAREFGSQGQQRMVTLALKFGEVEATARNWGEQPILLLDDISSELDRERNQMLLKLVSDFKPQVFLTTTDERLALPSGLGEYARYGMKAGILKKQE